MEREKIKQCISRLAPSVLGGENFARANINQRLMPNINDDFIGPPGFSSFS